jgi:aryl-alcohol dehydrogenase-like predicted oxidoreductase
MNYRELGRTGWKVSEIGFGARNFAAKIKKISHQAMTKKSENLSEAGRAGLPASLGGTTVSP